MNATGTAPARIPWVTLAVGLAVLALGFSPTWSTALQFQRDRILASSGHEWWRLFSAHLTHWTPAHLATELAVFLACGWFVERRSRALLVATLLVAAPVVSLAVLGFEPHIETYRGLSGVVSAQFAVVAIELWRRATTARSRVGAVLALAGVLLLVGKSLVDLAGAARSTALLSGDSAPVPIAHLVGLATGVCIAFATIRETTSTARSEARLDGHRARRPG